MLLLLKFGDLDETIIVWFQNDTRRYGFSSLDFTCGFVHSPELLDVETSRLWLLGSVGFFTEIAGYNGTVVKVHSKPAGYTSREEVIPCGSMAIQN